MVFTVGRMLIYHLISPRENQLRDFLFAFSAPSLFWFSVHAKHLSILTLQNFTIQKCQNDSNQRGFYICSSTPT